MKTSTSDGKPPRDIFENMKVEINVEIYPDRFNFDRNTEADQVQRSEKLIFVRPPKLRELANEDSGSLGYLLRSLQREFENK